MFLFIFAFHEGNAQNIGINGTGNNPDPSAMLDVEAPDKGVLIPRLQLDDATTAAPVAGPAEGLLIYNETGAEPKGYYYWDAGLGEWIMVGSGADDLYWDRDAANGYLFPSNIGDHIGIGTNAPTTIPNTQMEQNFSGFSSKSYVSDGVQAIVTASGSNSRVSIGSFSNHDVYYWTGTILSMRTNSSGNGSHVQVNPTTDGVDFNIVGSGDPDLFWSDVADNRIGIGTQFPGEDLEVNDADGDGDAVIEIGTVEQIADAGGNLLQVRNADLEIDGGWDLIMSGTSGIEDNNGAIGNNGDILSSTGNGVEWVNSKCLDAGDVHDGFEGNMGNWYNVGGDDDDWEVNSGGTSSTNTGPGGASEGNDYIYCETSGSANGDQYFVETNGFLCENASISFDYHMYFNGNTDGTLILQVSTDGGATWNNEWSRTGDQGTAWNTATVNLGGYANSEAIIRFSFTTGGGTTYQYDASLDDITITNISEVGAFGGGGGVAANDFWYYETTAQRMMRNVGTEQDCVLVGTDGIGPNYPYHFAVDNGSATGTQIGIGSVEYLTDASSETTINNRFSPADDNQYDLGNSTRAWQDVFSVNGMTVTSDERKKEAIEDLNDRGLGAIMKLRPVSFKWKQSRMGDTEIPDELKERKLGLIAQEVNEVIPEAVKKEDWDVPSEDEPNTFEKLELGTWGITYNELIPVLIKAIQEQQAQIEEEEQGKEELKKRLDELEEENSSLKERLRAIEKKLQEEG